MEQKKRVPKKGAAKKWSERLNEVAQQPPSKDILEKLNRTEKPKKIASSNGNPKDLEV